LSYAERAQFNLDCREDFVKLGGRNIKILVDARMMNDSGIGRYLRGLIIKLINSSQVSQITLIGTWPTDQELQRKWKQSNKVSMVPYKAKVYGIKHQIYGSWLFYKLARSHDVVHFPHFDVPLYVPINSVATIHDLIHLRLPQFFPFIKRFGAVALINRVVKKCKGICVVSESTKRDLVEMFKCPSGKISVIYPELDPKFYPQRSQTVANFKHKKGLTNYLLCVGNLKPHKNLTSAVQAFNAVRGDFNDLKLVIIGKNFGDDGLGDITKENREIVFTGEVNEEELLLYYCGASVFLFLSLYEGFGLPPLEAMACGVPVIASNTSSIPEVVGTGGILVNPLHLNEICQQIRRVLRDGHTATIVADDGLKRVEVFRHDQAQCSVVNSLYQRVCVLSRI
jgi:glycosyltransferase involved in cell wall biosynthesis